MPGPRPLQELYKERLLTGASLFEHQQISGIAKIGSIGNVGRAIRDGSFKLERLARRPIKPISAATRNPASVYAGVVSSFARRLEK